MISRLTICIFLLAVSMAMVACGNKPLTDERAIKLAAMVYPEEGPRGDDLDIVIERKRGTLRLDNRTPAAYENHLLWLNQQYVSPVEKISIGAGNSLSLKQCVNRWREHFPIGGILTPDKGYPVVLAELVHPDTGMRHRLVVRKQ